MDKVHGRESLRCVLGVEVASEGVSCENVTALRIHALPMCCVSVSSLCDSSLAQRQHPVPLSQVRAPPGSENSVLRG